MSTRSLIGIEQPDGSVRFIYCHSDGSIEYNGACLNAYYQDRERTLALLILGDISVLKPELGHFSDPRELSTVAYHRDHRERWDDVAPKTSETIDAFFAEDYSAEYLYLYRRDDTWYVSKRRGRGFEPLATAIKRIPSHRLHFDPQAVRGETAAMRFHKLGEAMSRRTTRH